MLKFKYFWVSQFLGSVGHLLGGLIIVVPILRCSIPQVGIRFQFMLMVKIGIVRITLIFRRKIMLKI